MKMVSSSDGDIQDALSAMPPTATATDTMDTISASVGSSITNINMNKDSTSSGMLDSDTDVDRRHNGLPSQPEKVKTIETAEDSRKRLTVTFRDVTVKVTASGEAYGETLLSHVDPRGLFAKKPGKRDILHNVSGQVRPGEMLLVLGRPGAGCTSLLRVLSNHRESFDEVHGDVSYGSMDHVQAQQYRQQITLNTEGAFLFFLLSVLLIR